MKARLFPEVDAAYTMLKNNIREYLLQNTDLSFVEAAGEINSLNHEAIFILNKLVGNKELTKEIFLAYSHTSVLQTQTIEKLIEFGGFSAEDAKAKIENLDEFQCRAVLNLVMAPSMLGVAPIDIRAIDFSKYKFVTDLEVTNWCNLIAKEGKHPDVAMEIVNSLWDPACSSTTRAPVHGP